MLQFFKKHLLWLEFAGAIALSAVFAYWGYECGGFGTVDQILGTNRAEVYGTLATIFGSLLGFVIVAVSIVINYSDQPRMKVIRQSKQYDTLWQVFIATIRALGFVSVFALLGLILDRPDDPSRIVMLFAFFGTLLAGVRVATSVWVLENVIHLVIREGQHERQSSQAKS